jgi:hypothetical protein
MLKDIENPTSSNVCIAAVHEISKEGELVWNVYVINKKEIAIEGILVMSKGYGEVDGESRQTSTLRHFIEKIEPNNFSKVEPLPDDLLGFFNEYFLTYYVGSVLFDKKFTFEPYSINNKNSAFIDSLGQNGILLS